MSQKEFEKQMRFNKLTEAVKKFYGVSEEMAISLIVFGVEEDMKNHNQQPTAEELEE